jgi:Zn-dependent protease with chaperone function
MADKSIDTAAAAAQQAGINAQSAKVIPPAAERTLSMADMLNMLSFAQATGEPRPEGIPDSVKLPYTADTVKTILADNADFKRGLARGLLTEGGKSGDPADKRVLESYDRVAGELGMQGKEPKLIVDHGFLQTFGGISKEVPLAVSMTTKTGEQYIVVSEAFAHGLDARQQAAILKHEMVQFKNGDLTPESMAQMENSPQEAMRRKYKTDLETGDPEGLSSALRTIYSDIEKLYLKNNPGKTPEDFKTLYDAATVVTDTKGMVAHPTLDSRLGRLEYERQRELPDARPPQQPGQRTHG